MSQNMGKVTTTLTVTNWVDEVLAERGFIQSHEVRSITLENVLVDTGASRLCLPQEIIQALGLKCIGENDVKTDLGVTKVRIFEGIKLSVAGREGQYN
jgi:predicted aspartyl protease